MKIRFGLVTTSSTWSTMSEKYDSSALEADPYGRVLFKFKKEHATKQTHVADLGLKIMIAGLQEDMQDIFGTPATDQEWKHDGKLLDKSKTLLDYDFHIKELPTIEVEAKST